MKATGKWAKRAVWLTLAAVLAIGCNPITTLGFIFHRDTKMPAEYALRPKEGEKHEKDIDFTVLVLCNQGPTMPFEFAQADRQLAELIGKKLADEAKANKDKITVVPITRVDQFKFANQNWKYMRPTAIGRKLGADCVLDVTLASVNLYQPNSGNRIYEGRAEVQVDVYDVLAKDGNPPKHHYDYLFANSRLRMVDASEMPINQFRQAFLDRLAYDLALRHADHKPADGIGEH